MNEIFYDEEALKRETATRRKSLKEKRKKGTQNVIHDV